MNRPKVFILGGGFAGVRVALDLIKLNQAVEVTLVNKDSYVEFYPDFYEIAGTLLPEPLRKTVQKLTYQNLKGSVVVPLAEIFKSTPVRILVDEVVSLDLKSKTVELKEKQTANYDILVLALGSQTNYFNISNMEKYSLPLKTVSDALNIRNEIDEIFVRKKEGETISVVIGGGGFTGCELAAELVHYLNNLNKLHAHKKHQVKLSVIEASPSLIGSTPVKVRELTEKRLKSLGINLYLNSKITQVTSTAIQTESGTEIPYDLLIWTAGIRANNIIANLAGVHLEKTCLVVDKTLRAIPFRDVFAIGDIAYCFDEENSRIVPATAQTAIDQGKHVAKNIDRLIREKTLELYKPHMPNFIIPLGGKYAVASVYNIIISGTLAWLLKRGAALEYFTSVLPINKALEVWIRGNKFFITNDQPDKL